MYYFIIETLSIIMRAKDKKISEEIYTEIWEKKYNKTVMVTKSCFAKLKSLRKRKQCGSRFITSNKGKVLTQD